MKGYAPIVRPWLKAGLRVLLMENEERVLALRTSTGENAEQSPAPVFQAERRQEAHPAVPQSVPGPVARPRGGRPPVKETPESVRRPSNPSGERAPAQTPPVRPAGAALLTTPGALPPERWPASWLALKNRRPLPSRPLVLWTYAGLGEDLSGTPNEERKRVIVRMLMELRHPAGTHVFWPFALAGEGFSPEGSLFWSGVKLLNPRVLLLFGSDTRDALAMPKTLLPFCQDRVNGRLVIQLPRPQALAADEASFQRAQAFLARILRFCSAR